MNMFGHDHITQNRKTITAADAFQDLQQQITPSLMFKQRPPPITAERDEV
jgi:hypothetical protein